MLRNLKQSGFELLKSAGIFGKVLNSGWRRERLLILCYHGVSLRDEHLWRPALYMAPEQLESRLDSLTQAGCNVLPLGEALDRLQKRSLPSRSVVLTFDDGTYDFYKQAYPILKKYGFPATVYQTTYYSDRKIPVFNLACSYLLWQRKGEVLSGGKPLGLEDALDLTTPVSRQCIVQALQRKSAAADLTGIQKNELARELAVVIGTDYESFLQQRFFRIMEPEQIAQLASNGIDFQLHTHRHRTPNDRELFQKEIRENRERLREITGRSPTHFCYPSGVYEPQFLGWLRVEGVVSATTCDIGMATRKSEALLLPRVIDTTGRSSIEFESWVSGVGNFVSFRRAATQKYEPAPN